MTCGTNCIYAATIVTALGALLLMRDASAAENGPPLHPMMSDRFYLSAGALWAESNVTANLNTGAVGLGTFIDFEDDVGLKETNLIGLFSFRWRMSERWLLDVEYFSLDRDNEKEISRTLDWGDLNVPVNASVRSTFDIQDTRVSVGYSFFRRPDKEIGIGLGAHVTKLGASLSTANFGSQRASQSAPLPVATMYARMALTDRWLLSVRIDRLSLDTGDVDGNIFSSATDFVYQPWRHFNISLGYREINYEISSASEDWRGKAQIRQSGPYLSIGGTF